jgi:predicted RNA-binding Zn ribbon-like protein
MGNMETTGSLEWPGAAMVGATGWLCLDLVNTDAQARHRRGREELLADYGQLVRWARYEGLVDDPPARRLLSEAARRPQEASAVHARMIGLRRALYAVLAAAAHHQPPPSSALDVLNVELATTAVPARLVPTATGLRREWLDPTDQLDWLLGPITRSATDLLTATALGWLKQCPGSPGRTCGFLFLDQTRNHSRRWCSSATCGNRTRLHRHYTRSGATPERKAATRRD